MPLNRIGQEGKRMGRDLSLPWDASFHGLASIESLSTVRLGLPPCAGGFHEARIAPRARSIVEHHRHTPTPLAARAPRGPAGQREGTGGQDDGSPRCQAEGKYPGIETYTASKRAASRPADENMLKGLRDNCDVVINALGD